MMKGPKTPCFSYMLVTDTSGRVMCGVKDMTHRYLKDKWLSPMSVSHNPGQPVLPGGGVEPKDVTGLGVPSSVIAANAAVREFSEECGVRVEIDVTGNTMFMVEDPLSSGHIRGIHPLSFEGYCMEDTLQKSKPVVGFAIAVMNPADFDILCRHADCRTTSGKIERPHDELAGIRVFESMYDAFIWFDQQDKLFKNTDWYIQIVLHTAKLLNLHCGGAKPAFPLVGVAAMTSLRGCAIDPILHASGMESVAVEQAGTSRPYMAIQKKTPQAAPRLPLSESVSNWINTVIIGHIIDGDENKAAVAIRKAMFEIASDKREKFLEKLFVNVYHSSHNHKIDLNELNPLIESAKNAALVQKPPEPIVLSSSLQQQDEQQDDYHCINPGE